MVAAAIGNFIAGTKTRLAHTQRTDNGLLLAPMIQIFDCAWGHEALSAPPRTNDSLADNLSASSPACWPVRAVRRCQLDWTAERGVCFCLTPCLANQWLSSLDQLRVSRMGGCVVNGKVGCHGPTVGSSPWPCLGLLRPRTLGTSHTIPRGEDGCFVRRV